MMKLSRRSQLVQSSGIRRVFDLAATLENPINLSIGQPSFDAFPEMKQGLRLALESGKSGYTQTQGIAPLVEAVAKKNGCLPGSGKSCFITSGVAGGLFLGFLSLLDPGDEILIPDPFFVMYRDLAALINAVPVTYDTYPDFRTRAETMERLITPSTRAILVASPGNPTGVTMTPEELTDVVELARRHDVWVIYDEIYSAFNYDAAHTELKTSYEKVLVLNGFSKSHGVCGWRVGYAIGPEQLIEQMMKLQQYSFVCAPSIAQWGVLAGFQHDFSETRADYRKKRDFLVRELSPVLEFVKPGGAFYIFPKVPRGSGSEFFERCAEKKLLLVPGIAFSSRDTHVRISFSAPLEQLERGVEVLRSLCA